MSKKMPLGRKRAAWAKQFKPDLLAGPAIIPNGGVAAWYKKELEKLFSRLARATEKETLALFTAVAPASPGYGMDASLASQARILMNRLRRGVFKAFLSQADDLAESLFAKTNRAAGGAVHSSLKELAGNISLKRPAQSEAAAERMKAAIGRNVGQISNMGAEYLSKIEDAVYGNISSDLGVNALAEKIRGIGDMNARRAMTIARHQSAQANALVARQKMEDMGVTHFRWRHRGGSKKPRQYHKSPYPDGLNGGVFSLSQPPAITEDGSVHGFPGDLINCRCVMEPVLPLFDAARIDRDEA